MEQKNIEKDIFLEMIGLYSKNKRPEEIVVDKPAEIPPMEVMETIEIETTESSNEEVPEETVTLTGLNLLLEIEKKVRLERRYLDTGSSRANTQRSRQVALDWLIQYGFKCNTTIETMLVAINIFDKYLLAKKKSVFKDLRFYAVGALLIARKMKENRLLQLELCGDLFDSINSPPAYYVAKMETHISKVIDFQKYMFASPLDFTEYFFENFGLFKVKDEPIKKKVMDLASYIMELAYVEYSTCHIKSYYMAAGAIALAIVITDKVPLKKVIEKDFQKATRTYKQTLKDVARSLARIFKKTYKELEFQNVRLKYADPTCGCISELPEIQPAAWKEYVTFRKAEPPKKKAKRN